MHTCQHADHTEARAGIPCGGMSPLYRKEREHQHLQHKDYCHRLANNLVLRSLAILIAPSEHINAFHPNGQKVLLFQGDNSHNDAALDLLPSTFALTVIHYNI